MAVVNFEDWLKKLGYSSDESSLHTIDRRPQEQHPYAVEINSLLKPEGLIRAKAVFDVEGVPAVVFLDGQQRPIPQDQLDEIRQKIWNQNLASIVVEIQSDTAKILPARRLKNAEEQINFASARPDGLFSAREVTSSNLSRRLPKWFDVKARVDHKLLINLRISVSKISKTGYRATSAQSHQLELAELLMGQVLFISYLEHRDIVGDTYRKCHTVELLHSLVSQKDRAGIIRLIDCLKQDFNGDFLSDDRHDPWNDLTDQGFDILDQFLSRTDMQTGQNDFWNYDFTFIPVELLSGLYESFLSTELKQKTGAYYTPRHLAMLAIDEVFSLSSDPLKETIFDGACGSGILLTTAFRRLIALKAAQTGKALSFKERIQLLVKNIFGADINQMACRVSAFSLYLSLLEGLDPSDIIEAQEKEQIKLPTLAGENLIFGELGDFFAPNHAFLRRKFSLIISNPPWGEAKGKIVTSADKWGTEKWGKGPKSPVKLRQIASAYSLRAMDFLEDGGKICLILPIALFLGPTHQAFVSHLFKKVEPIRLINFGDLQNLLFPTAEHTCHLLVGKKRKHKDTWQIPHNEIFDYCVPKADISLVFGRLTMQSVDRHQLQTVSIIQSPHLLVNFMWGDSFDLSLLTRLNIYGTLGQFWKGPKAKRRWAARKGVHFNDASVTPVSAKPLESIPHVPITALKAGVPVLHPDLLIKWPEEQETVANIQDELMATFRGPRVLYSDGFSKEDLSVRAVYFDKPASFSTSIGVISGPNSDTDLLKFLAVFLRSNLARYFLMMNAWKMLCERNAIHLSDIASFPFFAPEDAPNPDLSKQVLKKVVQKVDQLSNIDELRQAESYRGICNELDELVFDYFDLKHEEREVIQETVSVLMPSIRPRSYTSLNTAIQHNATESDLNIYAHSLVKYLADWRDRTSGKGHFDIEVTSSNPNIAGPLGIIRITYSPDKTTEGKVAVNLDDDLVIEVLKNLRSNNFDQFSVGEIINFVPDTYIWTANSLYLVRPITKRNWTVRQARRDAEKMVYDIQNAISKSISEEVA